MASDLLIRCCLAGAFAFFCMGVLSGCIGEETISIDVDYVCTDGSTRQQICNTWRQSGRIKEETKACFSEDAVVLTRRGYEKLANIQLGDEILSMDQKTGEPTFSKVRAWLHRNVKAVSEMTVIETDAGSVITSPKHSLGASHVRGVQYTFASDLVVGQSVLVTNGSSRIRRIREQTVRGHYSPLTEHSNLFVGGSASSLVLAHSFAHLRNPEWYEPFVHGAMTVAEMFSSTLHVVDTQDEDAYLHPVLRQLLPFAPFVKISPFVDGNGSLVEWTRNFTVLKEGRRLNSEGGAQQRQEEMMRKMMSFVWLSPQFLLNDVPPAILSNYSAP